jgi:hypothetical protein
MVAQFFKGYASPEVTRPREVTTDPTFLTVWVHFSVLKWQIKAIHSLVYGFLVVLDHLGNPKWTQKGTQRPSSGRMYGPMFKLDKISP